VRDLFGSRGHALGIELDHRLLAEAQDLCIRPQETPDINRRGQSLPGLILNRLNDLDSHSRLLGDLLPAQAQPLPFRLQHGPDALRGLWSILLRDFSLCRLDSLLLCLQPEHPFNEPLAGDQTPRPVASRSAD